MLTISDTPNKDDLWSVRDENNQRVALFYSKEFAVAMVDLYNANVTKKLLGMKIIVDPSLKDDEFRIIANTKVIHEVLRKVMAEYYSKIPY